MVRPKEQRGTEAELITRARRRALYLLEQMDRTESQLRQKLSLGGYPESCIDNAIDYVKSYHYIDDRRYACNFVRLRMDKSSRSSIRQKLLSRGIDRELIDEAIEEIYGSGDSAESLEESQITLLLAKRNFVPGISDENEFRRTYQFLMRRGYRSSEIIRVMRSIEHS